MQQYIRVVACRGFERWQVASVMGKPVSVTSPINIVQYEGLGIITKGEVVINSVEQGPYGKRKTEERRIPRPHCLRVECLG